MLRLKKKKRIKNEKDKIYVVRQYAIRQEQSNYFINFDDNTS